MPNQTHSLTYLLTHLLTHRHEQFVEEIREKNWRLQKKKNYQKKTNRYKQYGKKQVEGSELKEEITLKSGEERSMI
jgi:phage gpG-like protein